MDKRPVTRRGHHDLKAWQNAMHLVRRVYAATSTFPQREQFGLTAQLRRAAVSVPSNIAEGAARESAKEFAQFLVIARGSLSEIETQLMIAADLGYLSSESYDGLADIVNTAFALIGGLLRSVRAKLSSH